MRWGDGVDYTKLIAALNTHKADLGIEADIAANATVNDVAAVLTKITDAAKVQKLAKVFNDTGVLNAGNKKELTKNGNNYTNTELADGWYLVVDESKPLGTGNDGNVKVKSANLLQIVGNTEINAKHSLPTLDKVIVDGENEVDANSASIGDVVTYRIKTKVPDITGYDKYFFVINDTLSKGLTYNDSLSVKVNGTALTLDDDGPVATKSGNYYVAASEYNATTGTDIKVVFENADDLFSHYNVGDDIVLEYKAILNENAVITDAGNPNTASLTYSNDPNEDAKGTPAEGDNPPKPDEPGPDDGDVTGKTPDDFVKTYTTAVKIKKVDNHGTVLTGAMFRITGEGVNKVVVAGEIFVEDAGGTYFKLKDGSYTTTASTADTADKYEEGGKKYKK
ncbi:isopeptide-forming domain-containing fimbrial protein, partial [Ruminococcus sp.]|uniref:isopeptide-forming domain-containing fimbrial protein n=1 Tax=Ruminococcus sp. TaxID=41978 RepID=UPI002C24057B